MILIRRADIRVPSKPEKPLTQAITQLDKLIEDIWVTDSLISSIAMTMKQAQDITIAKQLRKFSPLRPTLGMVLGSSFDHILSQLKVDFRIGYKDLPGFPPVGVTGHSGELLIG